MWYIHTMEFYSALKKKEILTFAVRWMNLEDITLSEISQSQEDEHCMSSLIRGTQNSQIRRDRKQKDGWLVLGGVEVTVQRAERLDEMSSGDGCW